MTEKQFLEMVINGDLTNEETVLALQKKATDMLEVRTRRSAENVKDNSKEKKAVIDYLEEQTENALAREVAEAIGVHTAKASAVLRQLIAEGVVERIEINRNSPLEYRLAGVEFLEVEVVEVVGDMEAE